MSHLPETSVGLQTLPLEFHEIKNFTTLFSSFASHDKVLAPFLSHFPDLKGFEAQIIEKSTAYKPEMRDVLYRQIRSQMNHKLSDLQEKNLEALTDSHTFSVSCGHQLNLAGGPVYMAYKILTVIALAQKLKLEFPQHQFVPFHWLATEDHDVEEICEFPFFGKKHKFQLDQTGAVGPMNSNTLPAQMREIQDFPEWMAATYESGQTLVQATRAWLNEQFGELGLLVIDGDDLEFKRAFHSLAIQELIQPWVQKALDEKTHLLTDLGFKEQIHARPINLFYLNDNERIRLEEKDGQIQTIDGKYRWTKAEATDFFERNPERLSPNVAFRPLYSQLLLPDVAFVGGPAEIAYWLQLGTVFEVAKVPFPILIPRFSALYLNPQQVRKMEKLHLSAADLFKDQAELKRDLFLPDGLIPDLEVVFQNMLSWAQSVDVTLVPATKAEFARMQKQLEGLQKRIQKAAEMKNEQQIGQINNLITNLFPNGNLQERSESWLSFLVSDPDWLKKIAASIQPLDFRFQVLLDKN